VKDPVAKAFNRLSEEFESAYCKMLDLPVIRHYIITIGSITSGTIAGWKKIALEKEIKEKTRITIKKCRFETDDKNRIILTVTCHSQAEMDTLVEKQKLWLREGWKILSAARQGK